MAAILGGQTVDETGTPQLAEAATVRQGGQTVEPGGDKDRAAIRVFDDVMGVDVACRVPRHRHVKRVEPVAGFPRIKEVLTAPKLKAGTHPEPALPHPQTHRPLERAFEHRQPPIGAQADQEHLARLIGGQGEAAAR